MKYSDGKPYRVIALCTAKFNYVDESEYITFFHKVCERLNYRLFVFSALEDFYFDNLFDRAEEQIFNLMEPERFDAVIISSISFKGEGVAERIAKRVLDADVPCITLVRPIEGCINIRCNFNDAFEEVVRHVVEFHKAKHINFIAGMKNNVFSDERLRIYIKVLKENNIPIEEDRIDWGDFWEEPTAKVMDKFLASGKEIDAIICANDFMAMEAVKKLIEAGKRVPEDVIVSGFDGADLEKFHYPRICTSHFANSNLAETAGKILSDLFDGKMIRNEYMIEGSFRAGQSCGCSKIGVTADEVKEISARLFNTAKHERAITGHVEAMYTKIYELGHFDNLPEVWERLVYFINRYFGGDFMLALNSDFLSEDMEIWPNLQPIGFYVQHHYYTDEMMIPMDFFGSNYATKERIKRTDLVPHFDDIMDKNLVLCFMPIYVQNSTAGYVASGFKPEDFEFFMLYSFVSNLRNVIEMHKYRIDQQNLYSTDQLTKLLNRKGFYRHMEPIFNDAVRDKREMAVISFDMNWLKSINDTYGHSEGDFALAKIAEIINKASEGIGVSTRFGGDEFAYAFSSDNAAKRAEEVNKKVLEEIEAFNKSGEKPYPLSVSSGYVVHVPDETYTMERFIVEADREMYKNKTEFKETHSWEGAKE